jgi:putative folate metabolism gamma-glutamate ligase
MLVRSYKTDRIKTGDGLFNILDKTLPILKEQSILVITSKIISLCESNVIPKNTSRNKLEIIKENADAYLEDIGENPYHICLTIKNNILIPSAGIDESNGDDVYILYPKNIQKSATEIWNYLRNYFSIKELGVLITDSHTTPMRKGVIGIGIGWCGFKALYSYIGKPDCFGKPLRVTAINNLDALASAAVFVMGEGDEQTPIAVIENMPRIEFQSQAPSQLEIDEITIHPEEDLYAPLMNKALWIWN